MERYSVVFTNSSSIKNDFSLFDNKNNFFIVFNDTGADAPADERDNVAYIDEISLQTIAPNIIRCAESYGIIERLCFLPYSDEEDTAFLDISEESFLSYQNMLSALFFVCKCSLPYMLAAEEPEIVIPAEDNPSGIAKRVYNTSLLSMSEEIKKELSAYNITVKAPSFSGKLNIKDYL